MGASHVTNEMVSILKINRRENKMVDEIKEELERISRTFDGPISATLIYDPNNKDQKVFFMNVERLSKQS